MEINVATFYDCRRRLLAEGYEQYGTDGGNHRFVKDDIVKVIKRDPETGAHWIEQKAI